MSITGFAAAAAEVTGDVSGGSSGGLFQSSSFWILLAFIVSVLLLARAGVHTSIAAYLDRRTRNITDEIDRARRMREEAQELLASSRRRQREAQKEAAGIIEQARKDASLLAEETRSKFREQMKRRLKAAEDRIATAEAQAMEKIRFRMADLAVSAARDIIAENITPDIRASLFDSAVAEIGKEKTDPGHPV